MQAGERARRRVAAQDQLVVRVADARDLQLQVVLVGPEPGHVGVGLRLARDRPRHRLGLLHRVVHRFQAQAALEQRVRVVGHVAGGEDRRIAGAPEGVDHDAVVDREPGVPRQLVVRRRADPDHREVGREGPPVGADHPLARGHRPRAPRRRHRSRSRRRAGHARRRRRRTPAPPRPGSSPAPALRSRRRRSRACAGSRRPRGRCSRRR